jgi:3-isopropylmalate dehydrogenase
MSQTFRITLLPGDGIGPEIMAVTVDVLKQVGSQLNLTFEFTEALIGGIAIDGAGDPLPEATLTACRQSDAVLLAAIGGYKWDNLPRHLRPETGLLGLRAGLELFANLRPATILPQLIDASSLKQEVVSGWTSWWCGNLPGAFTLGSPRAFLPPKPESSGGSTPWPTPRAKWIASHGSPLQPPKNGGSGSAL